MICLLLSETTCFAHDHQARGFPDGPDNENNPTGSALKTNPIEFNSLTAKSKSNITTSGNRVTIPPDSGWGSGPILWKEPVSNSIRDWEYQNLNWN